MNRCTYCNATNTRKWTADAKMRDFFNFSMRVERAYLCKECKLAYERFLSE